MANFNARLKTITAESALCLGIDPSESELANWELPDTALGARDYAMRCLEAAVGEIGIVKPQVGFFERFGSAGFLALEEILKEARAAGLFVIADAKRGDIGTTMHGYAQAWFGDDSPLRSDALTVSPYLGPNSLEETLDFASDVQGGVFVLCATSNPEAHEIQTGMLGPTSIAASVAQAAACAKQNNMGLVIGATRSLTEFGLGGLLEKDIEVPILAPGFGFQGAKLSEVSKVFGASSSNVIASMSRGLTSDGPTMVRDLIKRAKSELQ